MGQPDAGFLDRVHPNAGLPVISRFFHDEVPYEDCSRNAVVRFLNSESVCRQICTPKVSFIFQLPVLGTHTRWSWMRSHSRSTDMGSTSISKGKGCTFTLQRRMEPLLADHGSPSKATVYTVFAAKENESDVVQVRKIWGIQKYWLFYVCGDWAHGNSTLISKFRDVFILDRYCHAEHKVAYWSAC